MSKEGLGPFVSKHLRSLVSLSPSSTVRLLMDNLVGG